ncbi:hypothetical protein HYW40_03290, partial [Candidatus Curtissbacteria bacterium]|nr:hypothetical protein [Candidatus Curtissbacteria bacterium]
MPLVSKRKLSKNIEERMFETLWEAISKLNSKQDIQSFLADLLSPVEIQMIAKRMAIAALLARGYGYESIQDIIKVSDATVAKVSRALNNNPGYKIAINKIARSEATQEFWHDIENLVYRLSSPG